MKVQFCVISEKAVRVDMYISALFDDFSRSYVQRLIDDGYVQVNGKVVKKNLKIQNKDELCITLHTQSLDIEAQDIPIDVVYEDKEIIILNKDAGINVHPVPGEGGNKDTLVNALLYHCSKDLPSINGVERPGIVHRLDKDTSGLIMIAKTDSMMKYLSNTIKERQVDKYYIAIVLGIVKDHDLYIESYIGRDKHNRQKMTGNDPVNPKLAITRAKVLDYIDNKYTLLRVQIETGRTHQIRVHLASIAHPIIGDSVYGNPKANIEAKTRYQLKRQALHASCLELNLYGVRKKFEGAVKADMMNMLKDTNVDNFE